ncbi:Sensory box/GGDEF domain/EAL domain protein [Liberibacter crescens BT-1]|uniref:Sensory box/GGDEF domain/EAL domain protein n=1 Tax=Liberibacter crescens (strain BT-1) TaxID=1215343 RepID=L0ETX0_LIBCB|nr:EAL domain-containing protein [Liberibacter crescens]AGA64083.1 Sensory box/GGDEF domain/EAL domain protein [Liberibacter crescens BT-1]AMC12371.1 diguanylate cyclase [Liberibacter crescens]
MNLTFINLQVASWNSKLLFVLLIGVAFLAQSTVQVKAIEPVKISRNDSALDLTHATEIYSHKGEAFQVSTALDFDGIRRRIEVRSSTIGHHGDWAVFALANTSDSQLERVISVPHFRFVGSQIFWPDLGSRRITSITPSEGFSLDRLPSPDTDLFRITINPGSIVTFVAELTSPNIPQIYLWDPDTYKDTVNAFTLYRGIVLGIAGLLAVFLTILFVVKGTSMLLVTATLAWAVLGYICLDFGFLSKLISLSSVDPRILRACSEIALSSSLIIFLFTYLNLSRWYTHIGYITLTWICFLIILLGVSFYDPSIASGIARISFSVAVSAGIVFIVYLGFNRYDRAILLIPAWALITVWLIGAWMAVTKRLDNDIVQPALGGGLVLIVLLIGFTVMQHAFADSNVTQGLFSDLERQSLAIVGSGDTVWDWDVARDKVITIPDISTKFGFVEGSMHGPVRNWVPYIHPDDRDCFQTTLDVLLEHRRGRLNHEFRIRADDGHFHWLTIRARPVLNTNGEILRCVGTISDVTEQKNSTERLLHDALNDNLTGLPNRQVFIDRLATILNLAVNDDYLRPTVIILDIDKYKQINDSLGIAIGDNILVALTRRLRRLLKPQDTLSRLSGDKFGIILVSEKDPAKIADFTNALGRAVMMPVHFTNGEIILNASIGLSSWMDVQVTAIDMLNDAELAMYRAKHAGGNRIEAFRPAFRAFGVDKLHLEDDLRRAIENFELHLVYQPIVRLTDGEIVGFEALLRWDHPKRGNIPPAEFIPIAENSDIINAVGLFALERAATDLMNWRDQAGDPPIFISINVFSVQLLTNELYEDIRALISKTLCSPEKIQLEVSESMVMENPEQARLVLSKLKEIGIGLTLDEFGTRYSLLSYLTRVPFNTIKIDRFLVKDVRENRAIILRSIISMAQDLGMQIIAEGIVSEQDTKELARMGCSYGQSYLFSPPMGPNSVSRLLKDQFPIIKRA